MAAKFTDKLDREWHLEITLGDVDDLRELGLDVEKALEPDAENPLASLKVLGGVLWHLCEGEAKNRQVGPEEFARAVSGPVRFAAVAAVEAALLDFSLPPAAAAKAIERLTAERGRALAEATSNLGGSSGGAGSSAGSSGSTQGPTASGS